MSEQAMRSFDTWQRSLRNFSWLKAAAPGAMDMDFLVERNGNFLLLETKPWAKGVWVPYGQHKALYHLSKLDSFRVYLIGEGNEHLHMMLYNGSPPPRVVRTGGRIQAIFDPERFIPTTKDGLSAMVKAWWEDAA